MTKEVRSTKSEELAIRCLGVVSTLVIRIWSFGSSAVFQAGNSLGNGRVVGKQGGKAMPRSRNFQGLERGGARGFGRGDFGIIETAQSSQRVDHVPPPGQAGAAGVGPELALPREPADHDRAKDRENNLEDLHEQELHPASAPLAVIITRTHRLSED